MLRSIIVLFALSLAFNDPFFNISCKYSADGEATATNGGGVPPYIYSWIPMPAGLSGQVATGLSAGWNKVIVTDANGCTQTDSTYLYEPDYLNPNIINQIDSLYLQAKMIVEGYMSGIHKSPYHGFSIEFSEHRAYGVGDEVKNIDWKLWLSLIHI